MECLQDVTSGPSVQDQSESYMEINAEELALSSV